MLILNKLLRKRNLLNAQNPHEISIKTFYPLPKEISVSLAVKPCLRD